MKTLFILLLLCGTAHAGVAFTDFGESSPMLPVLKDEEHAEWYGQWIAHDMPLQEIVAQRIYDIEDELNGEMKHNGDKLELAWERHLFLQAIKVAQIIERNTSSPISPMNSVLERMKLIMLKLSDKDKALDLYGLHLSIDDFRYGKDKFEDFYSTFKYGLQKELKGIHDKEFEEIMSLLELSRSVGAMIHAGSVPIRKE